MDINVQRLRNFLGIEFVPRTYPSDRIGEIPFISIRVDDARRVCEIPEVNTVINLLFPGIVDENLKLIWAVKYYFGNDATVSSREDCERFKKENEQLGKFNRIRLYPGCHGLSIANHYELISYRVEKYVLANLEDWTSDEISIILDVVCTQDLNRKDILHSLRSCIKNLLKESEGKINKFKSLSKEDKRKEILTFVKFKRLV
jgi:hypothetical protein